MDQQSRRHVRGVRTIGRLSSPQLDDVLLAQWATPVELRRQRQDVAIASEWRLGSPPQAATQARRASGDGSAALRLFDQYESHQLRIAKRLLDAIDAELASGELATPVFEPAAIPQEEVLAAIDQARALDDLPASLAGELTVRAIAAAECAARLWALIELYRAGHITAAELRAKRQQLEREIDHLPA
jgi:hypothetical protein